MSVAQLTILFYFIAATQGPIHLPEGQGSLLDRWTTGSLGGLKACDSEDDWMWVVVML